MSKAADFLRRMVGGKPVVRHVVVAQPPPPNLKKVLQLLGLRRGMWVAWRGQTGIVVGISDNVEPLVRVMLVDLVLGLNKEEVTVPFEELRQATYNEIPEGRRPSEELAKRLGYSE